MRQVKAVSIEGRCICTGNFSDVDGWGRAKIILPNGKIHCASCEQASLRLI
jgi:hypothetical protein